MFFRNILLLLLIRCSEGRLKINHEYARLIDGKSVCDDLLNITYFDFHKTNRTNKALFVNVTIFKDVTFENDLQISIGIRYMRVETEWIKEFDHVSVLLRFYELGNIGLAEIKTVLYSWKNNEYKRTPITWNMYTCSIMLQKGDFSLKNIVKDSSITQCPIKKGEHYLKNIAPPNINDWPSLLIPQGRWKLVIQYYFEKKYCMTVEWITNVVKV